MEYIQILLSIILGGMGVTKGVEWKKLKTQERIFIVLSVLSSVILGLNGYFEYREKELAKNISAQNGEILFDKIPIQPIIGIGNSKTMFSGLMGEVGFTDKRREGLRVYMKNKKTYMDMILRDREGKLLAAINQNVWTLYNKDYEYNNDDYAFEVVNKGSREVLFHAEYRDSVVAIEGYIFSANKYGTLLYPVSDNSGANVIHIKPDDKEIETPNPPIKRIFKYPRERFYSVRED